jgi:hypothetical protein
MKSWFLKRLKEPTTWVGLAFVAQTVGISAEMVQGALPFVSAACAGIGIVLPEQN